MKLLLFIAVFFSVLAKAEEYRPEYSVAVTGLAAAPSGQDILSLKATGSKILRLKRIVVGGVATGSSVVSFKLIKHSSLDTGGSSAVQTVVAHNSSSPTAQGSVTVWTSNPTSTGTVVGSLASAKLALSANSASANPNQSGRIEYMLGEEGPVIQGNQEAVLNWNGNPVNGALLDIYVTWSEE